MANFTLKPNIRTLLIEDSMLNVRNLHSILRTQFAQKIIALKLPRNTLGDAGISFLFESDDRLCHLQKLDLSSNLITKVGAEKIAEATKLTKLRVLDLCSNKLKDEGFSFLILSRNFPALIDLRLDTNEIEEAGAQALTHNCNLELRKLTIRSNSFKMKGCQYVQIYAFRDLQELNMSRNGIMNEGVAKLADASYLRNLVKLCLDDNLLSD